MKNLLYISSLALISFLSLSFINSAAPIEEIAINTPLPEANYKMKDVSGKDVALNDAKTDKGLLVIFLCKHLSVCEIK